MHDSTNFNAVPTLSPTQSYTTISAIATPADIPSAATFFAAIISAAILYAFPLAARDRAGVGARAGTLQPTAPSSQPTAPSSPASATTDHQLSVLLPDDINNCCIPVAPPFSPYFPSSLFHVICRLCFRNSHSLAYRQCPNCYRSNSGTNYLGW